jgi:hypothetical protein
MQGLQRLAIEIEQPFGSGIAHGRHVVDQIAAAYGEIRLEGVDAGDAGPAADVGPQFGLDMEVREMDEREIPSCGLDWKPRENGRRAEAEKGSSIQTVS